MATAIGEERKELLMKADEADEQAKKLRASGSLGRRYFFEGKAEGLRMAAALIRVRELYEMLRKDYNATVLAVMERPFFDGEVLYHIPEPAKKIVKELSMLDKSRIWPAEVDEL